MSYCSFCTNSNENVPINESINTSILNANTINEWLNGPEEEGVNFE